MKLDIDEILADMLFAMKETVSEDWTEVKGTANQFLQNKKERLELLAILRINKDLSQKKFKSYLEDEKLVLEAELHAIAIISKKVAQKATNAAISVLEKAISTIISSIL